MLCMRANVPMKSSWTGRVRKVKLNMLKSPLREDTLSNEVSAEACKHLSDVAHSSSQQGAGSSLS